MSNDVAIRFLLLQLLKLEVLYVIESCCKTSNFNNGLFIEGRKRTNGMLLERLTFLINPLTRQIVALVLCVTSIDNELVHSFKTPLNIVTCEPLSTLFNVVIVH